MDPIAPAPGDTERGELARVLRYILDRCLPLEPDPAPSRPGLEDFADEQTVPDIGQKA